MTKPRGKKKNRGAANTSNNKDACRRHVLIMFKSTFKCINYLRELIHLKGVNGDYYVIFP